MKTKILSFVLLLTCSITLLAAELKWRQINYDAKQDLRSVFAIGNDTAFIAGAQGAIFRTTDDAKSWTRTDIAGTPQLNSIRFATSQIGFAVGNGGVILKTSDGGDHWTTQNSGTSLAINALAIPKLSNIWAAGDSGLVIHSADSGITWSRIDTIVKNKESIFLVAYTSKKIELYSRESDRGKCYISEDVGKNWKTSFYEQFLTEGISYMNDSVGYSVTVDFITGGSGGGGNFNFIYTSNAGKDWVTIRGYSPNGGAYGHVKTDIHISNDTTGYIVNKDLIIKVKRPSEKFVGLPRIIQDHPVIVTTTSPNEVTIKSANNEILNAHIYLSSGSRISSKTVESGVSSISLNVRNLPSGAYIIRTLLSNGITAQTKWIKR